MLYELTYYSVADNNISQDQVYQILERSKDKNKKADITGCLVFHKGQFVQLLEGEKNAVLRIYEEIEKDQRHSSVTLIARGNKEHRSFESWTMAFLNLDNAHALSHNTSEFERSILKFTNLLNKSTVVVDSFWQSVRSLVESINK